MKITARAAACNVPNLFLEMSEREFVEMILNNDIRKWNKAVKKTRFDWYLVKSKEPSIAHMLHHHEKYCGLKFKISAPELRLLFKVCLMSEKL